MLYFVALLPIVFFANWRSSNNQLKIALFIWFIVLVVFAGLRGNITADYKNYYNIFINYSYYSWEKIFSYLSIKSNFSGYEIGYVLLNFIISRITHNYMWVQIVCAIVTYGCVFFGIKSSKNPPISILSFLSYGIFFEGFNSVRNCMAAAICFAAFYYIKNEEFIKWTLLVIVASLFHSTALIMIPFYFVLKIKPQAVSLMGYVVCSMIALLLVNDIGIILNNIFFFTQSDTVLDMMYNHSNSFGAIIVPISISLFTLILYYKSPEYYSNNEKKEEMLLVNGVIIWIILKLFTLRVGYAERFAEYFSFYIILLLPMELKKLTCESKRFIVPILIIIMIVYFFWCAKTGYGKYITLFD